LDEIPLSRLIGTAVVVDVSKKASENPNYEIGIDDFKKWEDENGLIPDHSIV
jgi:kynurenine formamidase